MKEEEEKYIWSTAMASRVNLSNMSIIKMCFGEVGTFFFFFEVHVAW